MWNVIKLYETVIAALLLFRNYSKHCVRLARTPQFTQIRRINRAKEEKKQHTHNTTRSQANVDFSCMKRNINYANTVVPLYVVIIFAVDGCFSFGFVGVVQAEVFYLIVW